MPISAFSEGLAKVLRWLPGTYATSILRNHALRGAVDALPDTLPKDVVEALKESTDMSITVLGDEVSTARMYLILTVALALSVGIYVLIHMLRSKKKHSGAR